MSAAGFSQIVIENEMISQYGAVIDIVGMVQKDVPLEFIRMDPLQINAPHECDVIQFLMDIRHIEFVVNRAEIGGDNSDFFSV
jgi:hypothetical protein